MHKTIFSKQADLISERIRKLREASGYTSRELSARLGKGHSFISNCEVGQRRVDIAEFYWICKECEASAEKEIRSLIKDFESL